MNRHLVTLFAAAVVVSSTVASPARAADDWQVTVAPYAFGAALDGTLAVRGQNAPVDLSASDLYEDLEFGVMGMVAARKGDWGLFADGFYVALGDQTAMPPADVDTSLTIASFSGVRRINDVADVTLGIRYQRLDVEIALRAPLPPLEVERSHDWVDPVVGVVLHSPGSSRWHATLIADIGGFGAGSDLTWQVFPSVGYRVGERVSLEVGYRWLDTDYEDGSGVDRFAWDMQLAGPAAGVVIRF